MDEQECMVQSAELEEQPDADELLRLTATKRDRGEGSVYVMSRGEDTGDTTDDEQREKEPWPSRLKHCIQGAYKILVSNLGLIFLLILYTCAGAALFQFIEGSNEEAQNVEIKTQREEIVQLLWNLSRTLDQSSILNETSTNLTNTTRETLLEYEERLREVYRNGGATQSPSQDWTFWGALFFCGTVYTSIGYGHIAPSTVFGRLACILYAAIGIPLAMIVLADLGKRLTRGLKCLWAFVRRYYYTGYCRRVKVPLRDSRSQSYDINIDPEVNLPVANGTEVRPGVNMYYGYEVDDQFNLPITVAVLVIIVYLLFGAGMYTIWEEWDYLEAFYFVFISLSTIGFGDVLPAHPKYFLLSSVYIFIGLSLISMVINVAMEFFSETMDKAKEQIDKAKEMTLDKAKEKYDQAKEKVAEIKNKLESDSVSSVYNTDEGASCNGKNRKNEKGKDNGEKSGKRKGSKNGNLRKTPDRTYTPKTFNPYNSTGSVSMLDDVPYITD